jgi:hypothetical protein
VTWCGIYGLLWQNVQPPCKQIFPKELERWNSPVAFAEPFAVLLDIGVANIAMITLAMQRGYFQGFCWAWDLRRRPDLRGAGAGGHDGVVRNRALGAVDRWFGVAGVFRGEDDLFGDPP